MSWSLLYGSWIYNFLCNQCLSKPIETSSIYLMFKFCYLIDDNWNRNRYVLLVYISFHISFIYAWCYCISLYGEHYLIIINFALLVDDNLPKERGPCPQWPWDSCHIALRRVWRYQSVNQNPYNKEQTTQWAKVKLQKDKQRSTKHTISRWIRKFHKIYTPIVTTE